MFLQQGFRCSCSRNFGREMVPAENGGARPRKKGEVKMYAVEKDVPVPPPESSGGPEVKYPWNYMEPGDSFLVPCAAEERGRVSRNLSNCARKYRINVVMGRKFTIRRVDDGVRVWRTE